MLPLKTHPSRKKTSFTLSWNEPLPMSLRMIPSNNARVGQDSHEISPLVVGKHGFHDISNANGERLRDYCEAAHLHISSTRFPHSKKRLWTWTHPTGVRAHLDHILCSRKWHNSARNCRSYNSVNL